MELMVHYQVPPRHPDPIIVESGEREARASEAAVAIVPNKDDFYNHLFGKKFFSPLQFEKNNNNRQKCYAAC